MNKQEQQLDEMGIVRTLLEWFEDEGDPFADGYEALKSVIDGLDDAHRRLLMSRLWSRMAAYHNHPSLSEMLGDEHLAVLAKSITGSVVR